MGTVLGRESEQIRMTPLTSLSTRVMYSPTKTKEGEHAFGQRGTQHRDETHGPVQETGLYLRGCEHGGGSALPVGGWAGVQEPQRSGDGDHRRRDQRLAVLELGRGCSGR